MSKLHAVQAVQYKNIIFSIGHSAESNRNKAQSMPWAEFVSEMREYARETGVEFTGSETQKQYEAKKKRQSWIAAEFEGKRGNDNVIGRSLLFVDLDGTDDLTIKRVRDTLEDYDLAYLIHGTSSDRHDLKGGKRAVRILIPTAKPMAADEIWTCQHALYDMLGLTKDNADVTACQRARLMFVPPLGCFFRSVRGEPANVRRLLRHKFECPSETGSTKWTEDALANADENSQAIAGWAFEMGLELMGTGRGWAVQCPNHMAHTDNDGTDGSTALMLPDSIHPEIRFKCQHAHCQELNRHQQLMMHLLGVPRAYQPEPHNISKKTISEMLPFFDAEDIDSAHRAANDDKMVCTDADLMNETTVSKRDPIIHGLMNFKTTFELVGESNIGKSFEMLSRMACVATGRDYASFPTHRAHCFYFDAEGGDDTEIRVKALQEQLEDPLEWLHVIDIQKERLDPTNAADMDRIINMISRAAGNDPVGLVAFDSLNQTMVNYKAGNFDENNSTDMGRVAAALKTIAATTGACAGVIHHPAKTKTGTPLRVGRGSGALHGAVDVVYVLEEAGDGLNHYVEKNRPSGKALPFGLKKMVVKVAGVEVKEAPERNPHNAAKWGLVEVPATLAPSNETLFVVPIRLAAFESAASEAGRKAVRPKYSDGIKNLKDKEKAALNALEELQNENDSPRGYSVPDIAKSASSNPGGSWYATMKTLLAMRGRVVVLGKDNRGRNIEGHYRIPTAPKEYEDRETADDYEITAELSDD